MTLLQDAEFVLRHQCRKHELSEDEDAYVIASLNSLTPHELLRTISDYLERKERGEVYDPTELQQ